MRNIALAVAAAAAVTLACATSRTPEQPVARAPAAQSPVATQRPYEMKGTVQAVGEGLLGVGRSITIARDQAPAATLHVADETRIVVDGRVARLADLRPGDDVRAVFDFDRSTPVAIEIETKPRR